MHKPSLIFSPSIMVWSCIRCDEVESWRHMQCVRCQGPRDPVQRKVCPQCDAVPEWTVSRCPQCGLDFETYKRPPERWRFRGYGW